MIFKPFMREEFFPHVRADNDLNRPKKWLSLVQPGGNPFVVVVGK